MKIYSKNETKYEENANWQCRRSVIVLLYFYGLCGGTSLWNNDDNDNNILSKQFIRWRQLTTTVTAAETEARSSGSGLFRNVLHGTVRLLVDIISLNPTAFSTTGTVTIARIESTFSWACNTRISIISVTRWIVRRS